MHNLVLLSLAGVEVLPVSRMVEERYVYMPQFGTLFVDATLPLDELFAICEDVLTESIEAGLSLNHWTPGPSPSG